MGLAKYIITTLLVIMVVVGLHTLLFNVKPVCGYDSKNYASIYNADKNNALAQSLGNCVQIGVVTQFVGDNTVNPVEQSSIPVRIGMGLYQIVSYPYYLVLK